MGLADEAGVDDKTARGCANMLTPGIGDRYSIKQRRHFLQARDRLDALYAAKKALKSKIGGPNSEPEKDDLDE